MSASALHPLLLLSDSALPLGSFAFSSGLESFLAHNRQSKATAAAKVHAFEEFLEQSLTNFSSTALPYLIAAYREPEKLDLLDNDVDASTPCTVARRASVAQGRALLGVWDRALASSTSRDVVAQRAAEQLTAFSVAMKTAEVDEYGMQRNGHFAPLFGIVCAAMGLLCEDTAYLFMLNHAKAVLSSAVRASVMGPFQSHAILASAKLQRCVQQCIGREEGHLPYDTAVTTPPIDLWIGRHELLYSRIFNS
ncbi:hypothetical protein B0A50_01990 [Salinomyces thailandicus]|uniref:Urease accessory protein UreF n=1 Tax=Salinomyces thailandicus TaxID=706561 RepID=A0A4U0U8N0_9PEZI|nr:hypothetical protein B0A50_01990 [Salinomyces thailandica]